jgi:hypothetical protein
MAQPSLAFDIDSKKLRSLAAFRFDSKRSVSIDLLSYPVNDPNSSYLVRDTGSEGATILMLSCLECVAQSMRAIHDT